MADKINVGKGGELTSQQLVTIIIVIVSFGVMILFFFLLDFNSEIGKETCRNSVILRGTTPLGKDTVKLNCKTEEVCLTTGARCEQAGAGAKVVKVQNQEQMQKALTELMYDCWWQMGEGKVDYQPKGW